MPAINGADVVILIEDPDNTGTFIPIASQKDATFEESNGEIDFSDKLSRVEKVGYGRYSWTVTLDALYVPEDRSIGHLFRAMRTAEEVRIRRRELGTDVQEALAIITSMSTSYPDNEASTISISLRNASEWFTPSS